MTDKPTPTTDLLKRCAEIHEWRSTGVLSGEALRDYAKRKWPDRHDTLQMAEHETVTEALALLAKWRQPAVKGDPVAWLSPWRKGQAMTDKPTPTDAAAPECLTCSDHGAVGNILTAEPCPDCTRWNVQPAPATQQAGECVAELRRQHAENETLRAGYAAARLEVASLKAQLRAAKQINAAKFGPLAAPAGVTLPKFLALKFYARRDKKATVTLLFPGHEAADAWVRGIRGGQHGTE